MGQGRGFQNPQREQAEEYVRREIEKLGHANVDTFAMAKVIMEMGVGKSVAYRWIAHARDSVPLPPPPPLTDPVEIALAEAAVAVEVMTQLPSGPEIAMVEGAVIQRTMRGPERIAVVGQLQTLIAACNKVLHAAMPDGKVRNPRMMLQASDHLRRLMETAAKINESINGAAKFERCMDELVAELRKESRPFAERVVQRLSLLFDEWDA